MRLGGVKSILCKVSEADGEPHRRLHFGLVRQFSLGASARLGERLGDGDVRLTLLLPREPGRLGEAEYVEQDGVDALGLGGFGPRAVALLGGDSRLLRRPPRPTSRITLYGSRRRSSNSSSAPASSSGAKAMAGDSMKFSDGA